MNDLKSVIVIGASAGGLQAITNLVSLIDKNLDLAIFVVLHVARNNQGDILVNHIQKHTQFKCLLAENNLPIEKGNLYLAPPDYHMQIKKGIVGITKGAHENRWRPSVDVLFRSAAVYYGSRVTGIILTGFLYDGTSGMSAIKRCGGTCIVQEPDEAEYPDMPLNVLKSIEVDYRVPVSDMGYIIAEILSKPPKETVPVPEDIMLEVKITAKTGGTIEEMQKLGTRSNYTCPDCGGGLYEIKEGSFYRYRCYTGHTYMESVLLDKQTEEVEESLWISVRMLEERKNLLLNMALHQNEYHLTEEANKSRHRAEEMDLHILRLKNLLVNMNKGGPENQGHD